MSKDKRTPLVLVCGAPEPAAAACVSLYEPGTVVLYHDLSDASLGIVRRSTVRVEPDGSHSTHTVDLAGIGCCVSCLLREDLLPLLRSVSTFSGVRRIVVRIDPFLEVEAVAWALENTVVTGMVGRVDGPATRDVVVEAVIGCIDGATWMADATGDDLVAERTDPDGLIDLLDERTVAQVAVGNVRDADVLVVADTGVDPRESARLSAVLDRLAPRAPAVWILPGERPSGLLARVPATARRGGSGVEGSGGVDGGLDDVHAPLLDGQPPLGTVDGIALVEFVHRRPFHPGRLHDAVDVLLDGVVATRGRAWVATQPDHVLWLESAGGGLRVASAGRWLAAMTPEEFEEQPTARRALAAVGWDDRFGDRCQSLVVLVHDADPAAVRGALTEALLTDAELAQPASWSSWDDPFGSYHDDPCQTDDTDDSRAGASQRKWESE